MAPAYSPDQLMNHPSPDFSGSSSPRSGVARYTIEPDHEHEVEDTNAFVALPSLQARRAHPHRTDARQRCVTERHRREVRRPTRCSEPALAWTRRRPDEGVF